MRRHLREFWLGAREFPRLTIEALRYVGEAPGRFGAEMADLDERLNRLQAAGYITKDEAKRIRRSFPNTKRIIVLEIEAQIRNERRLGD